MPTDSLWELPNRASGRYWNLHVAAVLKHGPAPTSITRSRRLKDRVRSVVLLQWSYRQLTHINPDLGYCVHCNGSRRDGSPLCGRNGIRSWDRCDRISPAPVGVPRAASCAADDIESSSKSRTAVEARGRQSPIATKRGRASSAAACRQVDRIRVLWQFRSNSGFLRGPNLPRARRPISGAHERNCERCSLFSPLAARSIAS